MKPRPKDDHDLHVRLPLDVGDYLRVRAARNDRSIVAELTRILRETQRREPLEARAAE